MTPFSGWHIYAVDAKGRIMVPAAFREIIAANYSPRLYVTNHAFDRCLHIYPLEEWNLLSEKVKALPQLDDSVAYFVRRVVASAIEVEMDRQGRVLLPFAHRHEMGITGEAVIAGVGSKLEVWDRATWDEVRDPAKVDAAAYKKTLSGFGI